MNKIGVWSVTLIAVTVFSGTSNFGLPTLTPSVTLELTALSFSSVSAGTLGAPEREMVAMRTNTVYLLYGQLLFSATLYASSHLIRTTAL